MRQNRMLLLSSTLLFSVFSLSGCSSSSGNTLHVFNCEDYIGDEVINEFEKYYKEETGKSIDVIYDTYDTNETMLSSLKTGKSTYDLICCSDYTIQKMMAGDMLVPFSKENGKYANVPNYDTYGSKYLLSVMDTLQGEVKDSEGKTISSPLSDYAVGYMWGTLGVLYNPAKVASDKKMSEEEVEYDMNDWTKLWDDKYKGEMSIKDSMRDTYSVGIMGAYDEEIKKAMADSSCFEEGSLALKDGSYEKAIETYNPIISSIFNRSEEKEVKEVENKLLELKKNVFGFEVDSGKDDIVKGLVGMNLAWSGDAVYSMDRGDNESNQTIYYSIPKTGGNIWFDGWVLPKGGNTSAAESFVNFLSSPEVASENMDFIGYTSFIAGDTILSLIREWYDARSYEMYVYHTSSDWEESDFLRDEEGNPIFKDGTGTHDDGDDYGVFDMSGSDYSKAIVNGESLDWAAYQNKYNEYVEATNPTLDEADQLEEISFDTVDLPYMFEGTLSEEFLADYPSSLGETPDTDPYLFYSSDFLEVEDPSGAGSSIKVGRQFYAQYPDQNLIPKLAIMKDYGSNNTYVLTMWENVKSDPLPNWAIIVFSLIVGVGATALLSFFFVRRHAKTIRKKRREEKSKL